MLRYICVAYDDDERAGWGLEVAGDLARRASARLTIAHVVPPVDEAVDIREELLIELAGLREDVRWRHRLTALAATVRDVDTQVNVLTGRVSLGLVELLQQERPDLVVAGTRALRGPRRLLAPRLRHALLAQAPCPVMLVRAAPAPDRQPVVLLCGRTATADRSVAAARVFADSLRWRLVRCRAPAHGRDAATLNAVLTACREHRPGFAVIAGERCHGLRSRLGMSGTAALIDAAPCPVLVLSPAGRQAPIVCASRRQALSAMASSQPLNDRQPALDGGIDARRPDGRRERRRSLLWQLFAANALVLAGATLVLIVAPVSVSRDVVLNEVLILSAGLAVMLSVNLVLLGRALVPLRLLTDVMGAIDLRQPGRRLPVKEARTSEVTALADAFNAMLDRLENERRQSARLALAAQEDERQRIAREIHDQVGQTLTAVTIQAERAVQMQDPVDRRLLEQIARTALQTLDDVRRIGRELRPEALDDLGLGNALITLCRRLAAQSGIRIVHALDAGVPPLRAEVELVIYRIAQEAITNALRHAAASRIDVGLRCSGGLVELSACDDGRGMPTRLPDDTAGISGMRERALLVGGDLRLRSRPGGGTEVRLTIRLEEAAA